MTGLLLQMPVLLLAVPLLSAALLAAVGHWLPRVVADVVAIAVSSACFAGATWLTVAVDGGHLVTWVGGWLPHHGSSVGIALVADRFAAGLTAVAAGLVAVALVYSWRFLEDVAATYHVLMLVFLAAMAGFVLAGDLFDMFVWFELMGVAAYALCGLRVEESRSVHGAMVFGVVNTLGASFSLVGIALLYARTGELNLALVAARLQQQPADRLVLVSCALLFAGVLVKAAAVPFHFWTADAEAVAPSPVCAVLSGAMVAVGVYAVARWWWVVFDDVVPTSTMRPVLLGVGVATALVGAVMCVTQRHIKRLLAYSTIGHVGVCLIGVGLLDEHGTAAVGMYVVGQACAKGALFLAAGVLLNRFSTVDEHALYGRARSMPVTGSVFVVGGLGLAGFPAVGVWLGKSMLEHALLLVHHEWLVAVVLLVGTLTGGAVLRVAARVFLGLGTDPRRAEEEVATEETESEASGGPASPAMLAPAWALLVVSVVTAALPRVHVGASNAAAVFLDGSAYSTAVLHPDRDLAPVVGVPSPVWTSSSLLLSAVATLAALAVGVLALWGPRLPSPVRRTAAPVHAMVRGLHVLHEGHLGNYIAWLVFGVAALGLALST